MPELLSNQNCLKSANFVDAYNNLLQFSFNESGRKLLSFYWREFLFMAPVKIFIWGYSHG